MDKNLIIDSDGKVINENAFQTVCNAWVYRYIGQCVSNLMYDIGRNLEECSRIFDFDYDEAMGWFQSEDWETVVDDFIIRNADFDELEQVAEMVGYWSDVCDEAGCSVSTWEVTKDALERRIAELEDEIDACEEDSDQKGILEDQKSDLQSEYDEIESFEDYVKKLDKEEDLRHATVALITNADEYREIGQEFNLDPCYDEIYEHWTINEGFIAETLKEHGQVVFDFGGMTIWGRGTTGQSISIDGVIRSIVKELDADHWVWGEAR